MALLLLLFLAGVEEEVLLYVYATMDGWNDGY